MQSIPRVYLPNIAPGDERALPATVSHHLRRVLRLKPGAPIHVFDGDGNEYRAQLQSGERGAAGVAIEAVIRHEAEPVLAIALAPSISRATRMEWTLEKAVELGAAAIHPVLTARGKVRLDAARTERRLAHWQAIIIAAAEQCGRARLPYLAAPAPLPDVLQNLRAQSRIVLLPDAQKPLPSLPEPQTSLALLTGPESGFDDDEEERIAAAGWQAARIGPRTLRTETAGPAALAAVQALWGDWRG
ncbi:MAG: 16S rRNA (uracil(1498)-N(3))-methyltransferase [Gammaproteobacteria bacterium]